MNRLSLELSQGNLAKKRKESIESQDFIELLESLKGDYQKGNISDVAKISILNSLLKLRFKDTEILDIAWKDVLTGKMT